MRRTTVLHLVGSPTDDFHAELSSLYARACLQALAHRADLRMLIAYVSPDTTWRFPVELGAPAPALSLPEASAHIANLGVDVVVPQMFCHAGMTVYRGLFDTLGIPYLGNKAEVMAVGADKHRARAIVAAAGVAVPAAELVRRGKPSRLPFPVVVKPVDADNSIGVSLARSAAEYDAAVEVALRDSAAALVESYVELGREVRCGIIVRDGELVCLPLEEYAVDEHTAPIRTRQDKLRRTRDGELYLVAKDDTKAWIMTDDEALTQRVWMAARRCHRALGCRHYSLFDFRIDPDGRPWFLEAGLYCSFSPTSVIAVMAAAIGIGVAELLDIGLSEVRREEPPCVTSPC